MRNKTTGTPCSICGCTETNLVDGFYYCVECGTQDTNVRETIVEVDFLEDGSFAHGSRKRIKLMPDKQIQSKSVFQA